MTKILTPDMLLREVSTTVILLMLINILLIGMVILLSFRVAQYKKIAEEMEEKLNKNVRDALSNEE